LLFFIVGPSLLFGWQPGDLRVLRESFHDFSEKARTRGVAFLALARIAFIDPEILAGGEILSILECT
jgi:hypothetical protein